MKQLFTPPESFSNLRGGTAIIGIDPGTVSGGFACLYSDRSLRAWAVSTPSFEVKKTVTRGKNAGKTSKRTFCDPGEMASLLRPFSVEECFGRVTVVIESVHAGQAKGSIGNFSLGRSLGIWEGIIASLGLPVVLAPPASWKKAMRLSKDKDKSRQLASQLYPCVRFPRVCDDGRAEALLLAEWYRRQVGGR